MHPSTEALFRDKRCKDFMSNLSADELKDFDDSIHDASAEKTDEIETDVQIELGSVIRSALTGRYRIFRKMTDDDEYWFFYGEDYAAFSESLEHEHYFVAAALAIRPEEHWEWNVVEEWSWVYRHAALLDIDIADFGDWCADQDPQTSRAFVKGEEQRLYQKQMQPRADDASAAANGDA